MSATQDYSKLKNAELEALLKERNLPHTGKKAEMVARLTENDKSKPAVGEAPAAAAPAKSASAAEDEITWEDDAAATTQAASAAIKAGGQERAANPAAVPNQVQAVAPSETNELSASKPAADDAATTLTAASQQEEEKFSANLKASTLDEELAKRKARAAKFGVVADESSDDAIKAIERAKRFGGGDAAASGAAQGAAQGLNKLDQALPERPVRGNRKRPAPDGAAGDDPALIRAKRRGGGGGGPGRKNDRRGRVSKPKPQQGDAKKRAGWMDATEKAKAEARKSRFASSASATAGATA